MVIWTTGCNLYTANHFVPVVRAEPLASNKQDCPSIRKSITPQQKHQGTLTLLFKPKASAVPAKKTTRFESTRAGLVAAAKQLQVCR